MTKTVIDIVRQRQGAMDNPGLTMPAPEHNPEMLLIGCVDARLSMEDIGIPQGKAMIYRNIAALVNGPDAEGNVENKSEAAVLEFAINDRKVKDIVVMGHTDCGGIRACMCDDHDQLPKDLGDYLLPLKQASERVKSQGYDHDACARAMEQEAVRQSLKRLMQYAVVNQAVKEERLKIHGWVVNTASKYLSELDIESMEFIPMAHT